MGDTDQKILEVVLELKDKLGPALGKTANTAQSSMAKVGQSMKKAGAGMSRSLTLPILAVGGAILKLGVDFDKSMRKVSALSGATGANLKKLRDQAKQLGTTTVYTANQAADAMGFLSMAGFDANQTFAAMPGVLDMAAAGAVDLATAADISSNILQGFGLQAEQMGHVGDVLAQTFSSSNVDLQMLGESMKFIAPVAAGAGLSIEEMAAAVGLLGNAGIQGSMAGTALRMSILNLAAPGDAATTAMKDIGMSIVDTQGNMKSFTEIIRQLEVGLEGMGNVAKLDVLKNIFGARQASAIMAILEQGSEALAKSTKENQEAADKAKELARAMMTPWERFTSAIQGAGLAISESGLFDMFTAFTDKLTVFAQQLAATNPAVLRAGTVIALIAAAAGPVLVALGQLTTAFAVIGPILSGPIGIAVAAVIAAGALLIANWDSIKQWADTNFPAIGLAIDYVVAAWMALTGQGAGEKGGGFIGPLTEAEQAAEKLAGRIQDVKAFWDALTGNVKGADFVGPLTEQQTKARAFAETIGNLKDKIVGFAQSVWDTVQPALAWLGAEAMELVKPLVDWFTENMPLIKETFEKVLNDLKAFWDVWGPAITAAWEATWTQVKLVFGVVWETIKAAFKIALDLLLASWKIGMQIFTGDWAGAWETIKETGVKIWGHIVEWWNGVSGFFKTWFEDIKKQVPAIWSAMWGAIKRTFSSYVSKISKTLTGLWTFIVNVFKGGSKEVVGDSIWPDMWEKILSVTEEYGDKTAKEVEAMMARFQTAINQGLAAVYNLRQELVSIAGTSYTINVNVAVDTSALDAYLAAQDFYGFNTQKTIPSPYATTDADIGRFANPDMANIETGLMDKSGRYTRAGIQELAKQGINLREMLNMGSPALQGWNEQMLFDSGFIEDVCGPGG